MSRYKGRRVLAQSSGIFRTHTGKGRRDKNGRDYISWCFANPGIAQKFASQFVRG